MSWTRWALLLLPLSIGSAQETEGTESVVISLVADTHDSHGGMAVIKEAYAQLGIEVFFRELGAADALAASSSGEVDAELQRIAGLERAFPDLIQVPIPINFIQGAAFSSKYRFPVKGWNSLKPYRIGIVGGVLFAEQGTVGMDVRVADTYDQLVRWLVDGEVDIAVIPRIGGLATIHEGTRQDIHELEGILETVLLYHYVHTRRADLAERLQPVLKEMLLDGTTKRLVREAHNRILGRDS